MSGRVGETAAGRGGRCGRNRGGCGGGGRSKQPKKHRSRIKELGDHNFNVGKMEDAGAFVKSKKELINYIRMIGEYEVTYVADSIEAMAMAGPKRPPRSARIPDPNNTGQLINDDVDILVCEGELKGYRSGAK